VRPPKKVRAVAARALKARKKWRRGGTGVGVARARDLKNGREISESTLRRMKSYFARHRVDKSRRGFSDEESPSAGRIAWDLWGGDAADEWLKKIGV
jgi:hypothetical protein